MRTIIAGSRSFKDPHGTLIEQAVVGSGFVVTELVCGMAPGIDRLALQWALARGVPVRRMPADWKRHGRRAGFLRNVEMSLVADALIAIWDGRSPGTAHMIEVARLRRPGMSVFVWEPKLVLA